jgi:hypothetical protein
MFLQAVEASVPSIIVLVGEFLLAESAMGQGQQGAVVALRPELDCHLGSVRTIFPHPVEDEFFIGGNFLVLPGHNMIGIGFPIVQVEYKADNRPVSLVV